MRYNKKNHFFDYGGIPLKRPFLLALACALLLTGCTGPAQPTHTPTSDPTAESTTFAMDTIMSFTAYSWDERETRHLLDRLTDDLNALDKLLSVCVSPGDKRAIAQVIRNEQFYYTEPRHGQPLTEWLWTLAQAVQSRSVLQVRYRTQAGEEKQRTLQPVGLMFSEFYLTDRLY